MGSYRLMNDGHRDHTRTLSRITVPTRLASLMRDGKSVVSISSRGSDLAAYELEPQLVTALFDAEQRSKRQVVKYDEIPKVMVDAVRLDRRPPLLPAWRCQLPSPVRRPSGSTSPGNGHEQGGSTITMQLSRAFFLTPEKTVKRKLSEIMIALELEQKFSKQQIFEFYANRVDLGQRGSFTISGFAEASRRTSIRI